MKTTMQEVKECWQDYGYKIKESNKYKGESRFFELKFNNKKARCVLKYGTWSQSTNFKDIFLSVGDNCQNFLDDCKESFIVIIDDRHDVWFIRYVDAFDTKVGGDTWAGRKKFAFHFKRNPDDQFDDIDSTIKNSVLVKYMGHRKPITVLGNLPRPAAKYPGSYPHGFEKFIPIILKTDNFAHFFAGMSKTGFRIDSEESVKPDLVGDVHNLKEIDDESFDGVFADPPYFKRFVRGGEAQIYDCEWPRYKEWMAEAVRITKIGGIIAVMMNYPEIQPAKCKYEHYYFVMGRAHQLPRVITAFRRIE